MPVRCLLALGQIMALGAQAPAPESRPLHDDWAIYSAARVEATGGAISTPGFDVQDWYPAKVPCTVLGALTDLGIYSEPLKGRNLATIAPEPFQHPWWYRTEFKVDATGRDTCSRLVFDGINYGAEVWLNGRKVAGKDLVKGTFNIHDLDVSRLLRKGVNALAVEVHRAQPGEFTLGFVDWNPAPPDGNMGIFRGVTLRRTGPVSLEAPVVRTKVDLRDLKTADLTLVTGLVNHSARAVSGQLQGTLGTARFQVPYALKPGEHRTLALTPDQVPALRVRDPRLWWPVNLGSPELYTLELTAGQGSVPSDHQTLTFGIRDVASTLDAKGHRCFSVNGKPVLIRGGGWVDDLLLREDGRHLEAQMAYIKDMNLNTVRLEGFWGESQKLYELADRLGLFLMVGFSCQWEWPEYLQGVQASDPDSPYGGAMKPRDMDLLASYLRDQARWLRNHPSLLAWVIGSDKMPLPKAEQLYREVLQAEDPGRPIQLSTKAWTSTVSGPSGVKMLGPYDYVTPNYWFEDRHAGGAYGFNTETGPGPQVPPLSSLRQMFQKTRLWPINDEWDYHCGRFNFGTIDRYLGAFNARYGQAGSAAEFAYKTQAVNYEAIRAMFEAFSVNKPEATGVIQWMLNAAWPKLYWQTFDYFLLPNGAYYGTRKGCQPLNLVWDCAHDTLFAVNDTLKDLTGAKARLRILRLDGTVALDQDLPVTVGASGTVKLMDLPAAESPVSFLDLRLTGPEGAELSQNFYWRSAKPDVLDPAHSDWITMGNLAYADFRALDTLPKAQVSTKATFTKEGCTVVLANTSPNLAFLLELQLVDGEAEDGPVALTPLLWDDNYVSLLPGESRTLKARYLDPALAARNPSLQLQGWNLEKTKKDH